MAPTEGRVARPERRYEEAEQGYTTIHAICRSYIPFSRGALSPYRGPSILHCVTHSLSIPLSVRSFVRLPVRLSVSLSIRLPVLQSSHASNSVSGRRCRVQSAASTQARDASARRQY